MKDKIHLKKTISNYYAERPSQRPPTQEEYETLVRELTESKKATGIKTHFQYHLLGCYDLLNVSGNTILTKKPHGSRLKPLYVITLKQLPQLLVDAHLETEHGSAVEMQKRLLNYDIPPTVIKLCVRSCQQCSLTVVNDSPPAIDALPDRLLTRIFLLLDRQSHLTVHGVCWRWRNVAELSWNEIHSLSFNVVHEEEEFNFVESMQVFFEAVIERSLRYSTNLQCLRLYELKVHCQSLNFSFAALKCLEELVLINVQILGFKNVQLQSLCSSMKRIYCGGDYAYKCTGLDKLCTKAPLLEAIYFHYDNDAYEGKGLRTPLNSLSTPLNSLREIVLAVPGHVGHSELSAAASSFPNLEFLAIFQSDISRERILNGLLNKWPRLKILCFYDCHINVKCLRRAVQHCHRLTSRTGAVCLQLCLDVNTLRGIDKEEFNALRKALPTGIRINEVSMAYKYSDDFMTFLGSSSTSIDEQIWGVATVSNFLSNSVMRRL